MAISPPQAFGQAAREIRKELEHLALDLATAIRTRGLAKGETRSDLRLIAIRPHQPALDHAWIGQGVPDTIDRYSEQLLH